MKRFYSITVLVFLSCFFMQGVKADNYLSYQDLSFEHQGARLLEDYSDNDYKKYYKKVKKKRFWGWRILTAQDGEKAYFTKETLYVIVNDGTTAITETFSFKTEESLKKQYSVSGTIGLETKGEAYGFKLGLEESMKFSASSTKTTVSEEEF